MSCCGQKCSSNSNEYETVRQIQIDVKEYYKNIAKGDKPPFAGDCNLPIDQYTATSLECPLKAPFPEYILEILKEIHPDVLASFYGCGLPIPEALNGCKVLDLGSGAGRDCYILSKLVGKNGHHEKAKQYLDYHADKFGYKNVDFHLGQIEKMDEKFSPNTFDVIVSNCVICLTNDKPKVFEKVYELLKPGGEMYFSDGYAMKPVPESFRNWDLAYNECFGGALVWDDFVQICRKIGFLGPFIVQSYPYRSTIPELIEATKDLDFVARTVRLFKPDGTKSLLKPQIAYTGGILGSEEELMFDLEHRFKIKQSVGVSSDVANAITSSRYAQYFDA
uniref:Arsenite methyltransferase n=1 Tax=Acrobeloides nanus TaxID=290746 RepID=A0A914E5N0_9BILA